MHKLTSLGYDARWIGSHGIGRFAFEMSSRIQFSEHFIHSKSPASPLSSLRLGLWRPKVPLAGIYSPGFVPPTPSRVPFAFTIHDLIHIHADRSLSKALYYSRVVEPAIHRANSVITVSEFSKARIVEWSHVDESKVHVVGNGVSPVFFENTETHELGYDYIFCCSNRKPHKNETKVIEAFKKSGISKDLKLVLTGSPDDQVARCIEKNRLESRVVFIGKVSDSDLAAWYKGAFFTVFASTYEGFGLPVVESMASGTPVIASNTTSLPEVGGLSAVYVDPLSTDEIAEAMTKLSSDQMLRQSLVLKGFAQARRYSWEAAAAKLAVALERSFNFQ